MSTDSADTRAEPSTTAQRNALSVVAAWRSECGGRPTAWGLPAAEMSPSAVNRHAAAAWAAIAKKADAEADGLAHMGFLVGHPIMREMRGIASTAASASRSATAWANDLEWAEAQS